VVGMRQIKHVFYHLVASPGAKGWAKIWECPDGKIVRIKRYEVVFPPGTVGELKIALFYGINQVFPDEGLLLGEDVKFEKCVDETYVSGDSLEVYFKNESPDYDRIADVVVEYVEVG